MSRKKLDILQKLSTVTAAMGNIIDSLNGNSTTDAPSIRAVNEALDDTKNQLLTGYEESVGNSYSGSASDYGIEVAQIIGAYEQDGTPTPDTPIEPQFVEINNFNTNGGNLFDASKLPTTTQGGATVTNNGDGSFTVEGSGTLNSSFGIQPFKFKNIKKGKLYSAVDNLTYPYFYVDIYWGGVYKRTITNINEKIVSTEITQEDIDNNVEIRVKIAGTSGQLIKQGTFKPIIYQDGDGIFYPYNVSNLPLNKTYRALPNGVYDFHRDGIDTFNIGYVEFDGSSDENWKYGSEAKAFYTPASEHGAKYQQFILCDRFGKASGTEKYENKKCAIDRVNLWFKYDSLGQSVDAWKKWLQSNPIKVWYELETPTTEQNNIILKSFYPFTNAWNDSPLQPQITWNILTGRSAILDGLGNLIQETPMTAPQSLIINGDFQSNQRGQTIYNPSQLTTGFYYTVDMWCVYLDNNDFDILEVLENGIKMKNSTQITQRQRGTLKAGTYTVVAKVNGTVKSHTFLTNGTNTQVSNDIFSFQQGSGIWRIGLQNLKYDDVIEYIDLFEGNIPYPHQKEDKATALMRCQFFIQVLRNLAIRMCLTSQGNFYFRYPLLQRMNDNATVTVLNRPIVTTSTGQSLSIEKLEYSTIENTQLRIAFTSLPNEGKDVMLDGLSVLISCEPL